MWPFGGPKRFDLADGHAFDADFTQGIFDLFEFERFDYRFNFFHGLLVFERRFGQPRALHAIQSLPVPTGG